MPSPPPPTTVPLPAFGSFACHPPGSRAWLRARAALALLSWAILASLACAWPARSSEARSDDAVSAAPAAAPADEPPAVRWSPRVRSQELPAPPAPGLPAAQVLPFLRGLQIVEPEALARAARIIGGRAGRALIATGDPVFARGPAGAALTRASLPIGARLAVLRPAHVLRDPLTDEVLGQETRQVALARLMVDEDPAPGHRQAAVLEVSEAREELQAGDLLLPETGEALQAITPHVPSVPVHGFVVSVDRRGGVMAGTREGVVIGLGRREGLEPGHLLAVHRGRSAPAAPTQDAAGTAPETPAERTGLLLVVRVHERLSQALVLQARDAIRAGDAITSDDAVPAQP